MTDYLDKVRCCNLEVGDIFKRTGYMFRVIAINEKGIYYRNFTGSPMQRMGGKSQEWVALMKRPGVLQRKIIVKDLNGNLIGEYKSQKEAEQILEIPRNSIAKFFNGRLKDKEYYGYTFEKQTS